MGLLKKFHPHTFCNFFGKIKFFANLHLGDPKKSGGGTPHPSIPCATYPLVALKGDILTLLKGDDTLTLYLHQ